jgi:hypothetical protein
MQIMMRGIACAAEMADVNLVVSLVVDEFATLARIFIQVDKDATGAVHDEVSLAPKVCAEIAMPWDQKCRRKKA